MVKKTPVKSGSSRDVDAFLAKAQEVASAHNSAENQPPTGRLIFALDATASRQPTWDMACHIQTGMFQATDTLGGLQVQLVYYRGFGECRAGKWQTDGDGLAKQMQAIECVGGITQIKRLLRHAVKQNKKQKINAVVFVGDAFEEDIDDICHHAGILGLAGVPVFMFQENNDSEAHQAFHQIAKLTNGAHCHFDMSSADKLRDLLAGVAIYASGGLKALKQLGGHNQTLVKLLENHHENQNRTD